MLSSRITERNYSDRNVSPSVFSPPRIRIKSSIVTLCSPCALSSLLLRRWRAPINVNRHLFPCERVSARRNAPLVYVMRARAVPQCAAKVFELRWSSENWLRARPEMHLHGAHSRETHTARGCNRHDFHYTYSICICRCEVSVHL